MFSIGFYFVSQRQHRASWTSWEAGRPKADVYLRLIEKKTMLNCKTNCRKRFQWKRSVLFCYLYRKSVLDVRTCNIRHQKLRHFYNKILGSFSFRFDWNRQQYIDTNMQKNIKCNALTIESKNENEMD